MRVPLLYQLFSSFVQLHAFLFIFFLDLDECSYPQVANECPHGCVNTPGSYRCALEGDAVEDPKPCPEGTVRQADRCQGTWQW